jgi:pyruvate formate lyase activating enzyme
VNQDGTLHTMVYGNPCAVHVDPVEKKPLFHVLPGSRTFSLGASGCAFRCLNCQNWQISQVLPEETKDAGGTPPKFTPQGLAAAGAADMRRLSLFPPEAAAAAADLGCASVAYTYDEPTSWFEYMADTALEARRRGLLNLWVTCGSINPEPLEELAPLLDAAQVDLKGFDPGVHLKLNGGRLQPVLDTLRALRRMGVWVEIVHLIVPGHTDDLVSTRRMCGWIMDNLGPDQVLHFTRFFPQYRLASLPPTPLDALERARDAARSAGLRYVYVGNAPEVRDAGTTFCPGCSRAVIHRDGFTLRVMDVEAGRCRHCGAALPGRWT